MEPKIEYKTFEFDFKDVAEGGKNADGNNVGIIEGYASTFGNMDLGFDIMEKGAFKKTLKETKAKWPILADHMPDSHIGYNLEGEEDDKGLYTKSEVNLDVEKGREKYSLAKQAKRVGGRMGMSIGFTLVKAEPDKENPRIRRIKEVKMWEHSLVTFPMNTRAFVDSAKSIGAIDKANYLISLLKQQGVSLRDLEIALRTEAAKQDEDPTKISQSIDNLIAKFKS